MWYQINKNKQKDLTSIQTGQRQSIETTNMEEPTTSTATVPPFTEKTQAAAPLSFYPTHKSCYWFNLTGSNFTEEACSKPY